MGSRAEAEAREGLPHLLENWFKVVQLKNFSFTFWSFAGPSSVVKILSQFLLSFRHTVVVFGSSSTIIHVISNIVP